MAPDRFDPEAETEQGPGASGRRVVASAALVGLLTWAALGLAFRAWEQGYTERARFGEARVASAVDPLAGVVPPGVAPGAWRGVVAETHAMLHTLAASNVLDRPALEALGAEVARRVARARPETARADLAALWDDLQARAGPVIARHRRPAALRD